MQVDAWAASPTGKLLGETPDHLALLACILRGSTVGPRIYDARNAAICLGNGVDELWTADRDFNRFSIRITNPVVDR